MSDEEFDEVIENVKRGSTWMRIVFMIGFCVVLYVVAVVVGFLTAAQALFSVFTGSDNRNLRSLGSGLTQYVTQILSFITYNSEIRPFPFSPFPELPESAVDSDDENSAPGDAVSSAERAEAGAATSGTKSQSTDQFDDLAFVSGQDADVSSAPGVQNNQSEATAEVQGAAHAAEDSGSELENTQQESTVTDQRSEEPGQSSEESDRQSESEDDGQTATELSDIKVEKPRSGKDARNMFSTVQQDKQDYHDKQVVQDHQETQVKQD